MSNVVGAACYSNLDIVELAEICHKGMHILDRFIARYGDQGGCDEGPGYWGKAAGSLLYALEHLYHRSGGAIDIYQQPKIRAMARYPLVAHLGWQWFASFADSSAHVRMERAKVWQFGVRLQDDELCNLAQLSMRGYDPLAPIDPPLQGCQGGDLMHMLRELWWIDPEAEASPMRRHDQDRWLPDVQVLVAHEEQEDALGLVLAAKAGHNGESHNHNDCGGFIVMLDGVPVLLDLGVGTYTRDTFGPNRYDNWVTSAAGHPVPRINGHQQAAGADFASRDVRHEVDGNRSMLHCDLAGCYPPEAGLEVVQRELALIRAGEHQIQLHDHIRRENGPVHVYLPLLTNRSVLLQAPGMLSIDCGVQQLVMEWDPAIMRIQLEQIVLDDARLAATWGSTVTRICCTVESDAAEVDYHISFRAMDE